MKRIVLNLVFVCVFSGLIFSQQKGANISFKNETYNFGKIAEDGGTVAHKFSFTNTGNTPLVISNVRASCGCTTSSWTKSPVASGEKGFVEATFNPRGRPGKFKKSITVYTNSKRSTQVIFIAGEVIPKKRTIEDDYPRKIENLRLETNHFSFTKVFIGKIKHERLKVYNASDKPLTIEFEKLPRYLNLKAEPKTLRPKEKGVIMGTYDPNIKNDWGFNYDRIYFILNGQRATQSLTISADIGEDFSNMTEEELKNAPRIEFKEKTFDFGTVKQQSKVEHKFEFKNTGKNELIIRKIRASCGCTTVAPDKKVISPGESSSITAIFSVGRRKGRQNKTISVITNDPISSSLILRLSGSIEELGSSKQTPRPE